jgi:hypothetical protein
MGFSLNITPRERLSRKGGRKKDKDFFFLIFAPIHNKIQNRFFSESTGASVP